MFDLRQIDWGPHCGARGNILSLLGCVGGLKRGNLGSNRPNIVKKYQQPPLIGPKIEGAMSQSNPLSIDHSEQRRDLRKGSVLRDIDGSHTGRSKIHFLATTHMFAQNLWGPSQRVRHICLGLLGAGGGQRPEGVKIMYF